MKKLDRRVSANARKGKGLTNIVVDKFCRETCGKDYKGVYASDCLPIKLCGRHRFIIVVNLQPRREHLNNPTLLAGHFVTIYAAPDLIYYLDPYGLPSLEPRVNRFLHLCARPVQFNLRQIQDFNSVYCGLFAILFANYLDKRPNFRLKFNKRRLRANDKLCKDYIARILAM